MSEDVKPLFVDCGEVIDKKDGRKKRIVFMNENYYWWDQDAIDRRLGTGKYLFQQRMSDWPPEINPERYK